MSGQPHAGRSLVGALCFAGAGALFVLYPALRPFSDEVTLEGAVAFASSAWILAHVMAMLAFILLTLGLFVLWQEVRSTSGTGLFLSGFVLTLVGVGLLLPFYGAEAFGLHAIGTWAVAQENADLMALANDVRSGPGLIMFAVGMLTLAAGAVVAAVALWKRPGTPRWSGIPLAVGFILFMPQFVAGQALRVAHGALIAVGCLWVGAYLLSGRRGRPSTD
jgi:hypothetical protein